MNHTKKIIREKANGILVPMLLAFAALALFIGWNYFKGLPPKQAAGDTDQPVIKEHLPDTLKLQNRLAFHDFESGNAADTASHLVAAGHTGKQSFRMSVSVSFSPGLWIRFSELKPSPGSWLRAEGYVWFDGPADQAKCSLVATCNRGGVNYKYMAVPVEKEDVKPGQWNRVSIDYRIPEPVGGEDVLQVYFWYRGEVEMLVDDILVSFYQ